MRIAVNATPAVSTQKTGVEYYTDALLRAMCRVAPADAFDVCAPTRWSASVPDAWKVHALPWSLPGWSTFRFSAHLLRTRPDVVFVPGNALPPVRIGKQVTTVHDLAFVQHPELYTVAQKKDLERAHKRAARADHIITISDTTKRDMAERYDVPDERMTTVHLGIDHDRFHVRTEADADVRRVQAVHHLQKPYILFIGRVEQKKGVDTLIRAYEDAGLWEREIELVLAGRRGAHVSEASRALLTTRGVRELGYVADEDVGPLLSGAQAFTFPTRKEGFGMPVLEAMASGVPVICSDLPVLREIAGDFPTFVPVDNVQEWSRALTNMTYDVRHTTDDAAILHAQSFTWDRCARETWRVLQQVAHRQ